jgi:hypothetical protein
MMEEDERDKQILQTLSSHDAGESEGEDENSSSHGTPVASKAAGRLFGLAKEVRFCGTGEKLNVW